MATTPRITSTEIKMPFQSRDLVGIETSSWRLKRLVTDKISGSPREQIQSVTLPLFLRNFNSSGSAMDNGKTSLVYIILSVRQDSGF